MPPRQEWPLVGREAELERIAAARSARPAVVLTAGPGVGKSRLAREAVAAATAAGARAAWIQATRSAAAVPLGSFAGLIPEDVRSDDPLELMRRSVQALREHAAGGDVVLGVDDAQLLDPTSAALVLHLTMTRAAFVLATVRTGEPCPDAVQALWKDADALRIDLRALTPEETGALVERVLGGAVEQRVGRWAYDSSDGNALYVRELVTGALDDGALVNRDGFWRLARRPPPSATLTDLVSARMEDLSVAERRVVETLALGEPLRLRELVELTGAEAVSGVEARGLVSVGHDGVRLAHPLYGEVVRASMPISRGLEARRELARVVGGRADRTREDALRIARWLLDAGDDVDAPLLVDAAQAATTSGDAELGARLATLALDAGAGVEAALLAARALAIRKRHADADALLAEWEGRIEDQDVAVGYLEQRMLVLSWGLQRTGAAAELLARAATWWNDDGWRRRHRALQLHASSIDAGFAGMTGVAEDLVADRELEPSERRRVELIHLTNQFYGGRVREAHALLQRHLPPVPLRDELDHVAMVMCSVVALESGVDTPAYEQWCADALSAATRHDDHAAAGMAATTLGGLALLGGRYRDATRWFEEAVSHLERHDPFNAATATLAALSGARFHLGDGEGVASAMERCRVSLAGREQLDTDRAYVLRGEAWEALVDGDAPKAQRRLLDGAERLAGTMPVYAAQLYHEALRAGAPARPLVAPMGALREACDAPLVAAYAQHVEASAARGGAALLGAAEAFVATGAIRYALECAAEAASAFAAEGRQDSARRAAARSRELYGFCQGGRAPEIRGLTGAEAALTAREAQLVELAARGLSNVEIADRLVLSTRTVESHLYRAMGKLGVSDRRDLPGGHLDRIENA